MSEYVPPFESVIDVAGVVDDDVEVDLQAERVRAVDEVGEVLASVPRCGSTAVKSRPQ